MATSEDGVSKEICLLSDRGLKDAGLLRVEFTEANGEGEIRYD